MNLVPLLSSFLGAAAALAQSADRSPPQAIAPAAFHGVFVSDPYPDGSTWVRGDRYKLGLDAAGAHFQPLFGPRASRDWPVAFALAAVTAGGRTAVLPAADEWTRAGQRFERNRGEVRERWDCAADGAQQSFVLAARPPAGDVTLHIGIGTELAIDGDGPGVRFVAAADLGWVRYSDAVAIDAAGRRLDLPVAVHGRELRITVPAAFAASAAWPLVVDPFVSTVFVDQTVSDTKDPRVASDPQSGTWLVVAEEHLSATDVDIVSRRYDAALFPAALLDTVYVHNTADLTHNPDVGSVAQGQQFVVAWHNTAGTGSFQWRTRHAASATQGTLLTTSQGIGADLANRPAIGGATTGDRFLLVLFRRNTSGTSIFTILLRTTGTNFGSLTVVPTLPIVQVAGGDVSEIVSVADMWVLVWRQCDAAGCPAQRIRMQAIGSTNGIGPLVTQPALDLATGVAADEPRIAGRDGKLFAVWTRAAGGNTDLQGVPIELQGGVFTPLFPVQDLTAAEPNAIAARPQSAPAVSYDGWRFVYAYIEDEQNGTVRPYASTVLIEGSTITWHEGHVLLPTFTNQMHGALALAHGNDVNPGLHCAVWDQPSASNASDVLAAIVDARQPGATSDVVQTGCGTPAEPQIVITGTPALGRSFTVALQNVLGFPFLLVGAELVLALPGCGACQSGVELATSITFAGSSLGITMPASSAFFGFELAFQGAVLGHAGGCPLQVFGAAFAVSDTLSIHVR